MEIIVFGAHPDDEHGMSGTICRLTSSSHNVRYVCTTDNLKNGHERREEMKKSADVLGIRSLHWLGEPDGALAVTPDVVSNFNTLVDSLPKSDVVFVMWPVDVHPDHRRTADLVMTRYFQRGVNVPMFAYALNSSGRAFDYIRPQTTAFFPTHYCDVGGVVEVMKKADSFHVTQDAPAMWKGVETMLRGRGKEMSGIMSLRDSKPVQFAEAFVYMTRHGEPPDWIKEYFVRAIWNCSAGIPYEVRPESVGL